MGSNLETYDGHWTLRESPEGFQVFQVAVEQALWAEAAEVVT